MVTSGFQGGESVVNVHLGDVAERARCDRTTVDNVIKEIILVRAYQLKHIMQIVSW